MSIVHVEAQLSTEELLKAVGQLPLPELEQFVAQVLVLQAQRRAPHLPQAESELLLKINEDLPAPMRARYDVLVGKRRAETLTSEEYEELLQLSDEVERLNTGRVEYLTELAQLRQVSLATLMDSLEIYPRASG